MSNFMNIRPVGAELFLAVRQTNIRDKANTDMRPLTTGIRSEKCFVKRFRRCANAYLHKPR